MLLVKTEVSILELMVGSILKNLLYKQGPRVLNSKVNNTLYNFTRNKAE